jgi:hypothetical protein
MNQTTGLLIALAALLLGAAAYLIFGVDNSAAALQATSAPATVAETQFLGLAAQIEPVTFDSSIVEDPRFTALQDLRTAIIPETSGRPDPFAKF